jgi:prepilin-type N-terminal cleavage/methylation domain-containing protein
MRPSRSSGLAFTLVELLVVVAVLSFVASLALVSFGHDWNRAKLNSTALTWASWLESVRRSAQRTEAGCVVTLTTLTSQRSGSIVATASSADGDQGHCAVDPQLRFVAPAQADTVTTFVSASSLMFTPRGTILGPDGAALPSGWELRFALSSVRGIRCIQFSGLLGALRIGSSSTASSIQQPCTDFSAY